MRFYRAVIPQRVLAAGLLVLALPAGHAVAVLFLARYDMWLTLVMMGGQALAGIVIAVWATQMIYHRNTDPRRLRPVGDPPKN